MWDFAQNRNHVEFFVSNGFWLRFWAKIRIPTVTVAEDIHDRTDTDRQSERFLEKLMC